MNDYSILYHFPGRIRIEISQLKKLTPTQMKKLSTVPTPHAIKRVRVNPVTGSMAIAYDPDHIDIIAYIKRMVGSRDLKQFLSA